VRHGPRQLDLLQHGDDGVGLRRPDPDLQVAPVSLEHEGAEAVAAAGAADENGVGRHLVR
jgi:hypothetical protein